MWGLLDPQAAAPSDAAGGTAAASTVDGWRAARNLSAVSLDGLG